MYSMITAFQQWAPGNGKSTTSLTDFIGWMNTYRNSLLQTAPVAGNTPGYPQATDQQLKFDIICNLAYAYLRGVRVRVMDSMVEDYLDTFDPTQYPSNSANPPVVAGSNPITTAIATYPTSLAGSTLMSSTILKEMMWLIDLNAGNTSTVSSTSIGQLHLLQG